MAGGRLFQTRGPATANALVSQWRHRTMDVQHHTGGWPWARTTSGECNEYQCIQESIGQVLEVSRSHLQLQGWLYIITTIVLPWRITERSGYTGHMAFVQYLFVFVFVFMLCINYYPQSKLLVITSEPDLTILPSPTTLPTLAVKTS